MNSNTVTSTKLRKKLPKKKVIIAIVILIVFIISAIAGFNYLKPKSTAASTTQQTVKVQKGDLSVKVSGSGPINSSSKYDVTSNVSGTLTNINFKEGDKVQAGDLLFEIDDSEATLKIRQLENSIAQARLSQEYNISDLQSNKITAPFNGEIEDLQVKAGDSVGKSGVVLTITDKSKLKLVAPFINAYRTKLSIGQVATVNALNTATEEYYTVTGKISNISSPGYKTGDGSEAYNVEVTVDNSGSLKEGMVANMELKVAGTQISSKGSSTLSYVNSMTLKSESGGVVNRINIQNGQSVKKGDILMEFQNDDLQLTTQTNDLKLQDLEIQLEIAKEKLTDYKIYSTIAGTFTLNDVEQGNSIKQGDILGSVANYDTMEFAIDVDELDIAKVKVGQTASVTIDALTDTAEKPMKGNVTEIAVEGTSSDGVSTYPVTIQLEKNESLKGSLENPLKGGMNANAEIIVDSKTGVLYVPIEAVHTKNGKSYVLSANEGMKSVTTGISSDQYTEIISGLKEGDTVLINSSTKTTTQQNQQGMGMPPMDGGGPPQGSSSGTRKGN